MRSPKTFADRLKSHLVGWAGAPERNLKNDGKHGWVLADRRANYFEPDWEAFLEGKSHRWGHALNSSQAFAINLLSPAKVSSPAALALWKALTGSEGSVKRVNVAFEYEGPAAIPLGRTAFGEERQTTQVDVAMRAELADGKVCFLLIEVKLSETKFGSCKGPKHPDSSCESTRAVLASPESRCWLAKNESRKYWRVVGSGPYPLQFSDIANEPCPWKGSLYQLMRNWAFGQVLVRDGHADDFHVGVCIHPGNLKVLRLESAVGNTHDAVQAFNARSIRKKLVRVDPLRVIATLKPFAPAGWAEYVQSRYLLPRSVTSTDEQRR